jgi:hypothetical protein
MGERINHQRRTLLLGSLGTSLGLMCSPSLVWAEVTKAAGTDKYASAFLDTLCDLVIPATDTPGAKEVGVAKFVVFASQHGLKSSYTGIVEVFEQALNDYAQVSFLELDREQQNALLEIIDSNVFSRAPKLTLPANLQTWKSIKSLILLGYYTSKVGGSEELRYQLMPGHFDPDVPVTEETRAWSSDWTGVKYG